MPFTILSAIYRTSGSQDLLAGGGPAEDSRSDKGRCRGPGGAGPRARAPWRDRHGANPRPPPRPDPFADRGFL